MATWLKQLIPDLPFEGRSIVHSHYFFEGQFKVHVFFHEFENRGELISCWSFVSEGMVDRGGREVIFTLRLDPDDQIHQYPSAIIKLFHAIYRHNRDHETLQSGDLFEDSIHLKWLGEDFKGIGLLPSLPVNGIKIPENTLYGLLLTGDEFKVAEEMGLYRMAHRFGYHYRTFPYPVWNDRRRESMVSFAHAEMSLLEDLPRVQLKEARVILTGHTITLMVPKPAKPFFQSMFQNLPHNHPLALILEPELSADARLCSLPGYLDSVSLKPLRSQGKTTTGNFIAFVPESYENHGTVTEDGFVMHLSSESWTLLRQALKFGSSLQIPSYTPTGLSFNLKWQDQPGWSHNLKLKFAVPLRSMRTFTIPLISLFH